MTGVGQLVPRWFFCGLLTLLLLLPSVSFALSSNIELEAIQRSFERDVSSQSERVLPGYGFLKLELKDITASGISFHGYAWGRYDITDSKYFDNQAEGELVYGYLEYRKKFSTLRARLGRMHVFEGVANETVDGLWAAGSVTPKISLSGYAGQPVGLSSTNGRGGDLILGGRAAFHGSDKYDVGVSVKFSNNDGDAADRLIGVDLSWALPKDMTLYGISKFNTDASSFAEHSWELNIPVAEFTLKPFLQYYDYDSYFGTGDSGLYPGVGDKARLPFRNLAKSGESIAILGLDSFWRKSETWNLGAKLKYYTYDQNNNSQYLSAVVNYIGEQHTQTGCELGYMNGEAANNNYLLLRLYTYQDQLPEKFLVDFISSDLVYALYDQMIYNKDSSLFLSLGAGKHFFGDALDLKLSGDYSVDPFYTSDLRATLSATYYFGRGR